jgi:MoaA/NifB/PqqE/SkfB family radical SAM enzyme
MDHLWFQVSGTLCNIACDHCFISCSPTNHNFEVMSLAQVAAYLEESVEMGVKEYYFTGGEPFLNKEIVDILELALSYGPVTVLTNGMLLKEKQIARLAEAERDSIFSLEFRVSIDGYNAEMNDAIRGKGVFDKAMAGMRLLLDYDFLPIITITQTWEEYENDTVLEGFINTLNAHGYEHPRLKILPSLKIGREIARDRDYDEYEFLTTDMMAEFDADQLICSNARVATNRGVAVCPILINEPDAILGDNLHEASKSYQLKHQACYTCYLYGSICSNFSSMEQDA